MPSSYISATPIAGVIISSHYKRITNQGALKAASPVNWKGMLAWAVGVTFTLLIQSDIKNIVGILVSGLLYALIEKITSKTERLTS